MSEQADTETAPGQQETDENEQSTNKDATEEAEITEEQGERREQGEAETTEIKAELTEEQPSTGHMEHTHETDRQTEDNTLTKSEENLGDAEGLIKEDSTAEQPNDTEVIDNGHLPAISQSDSPEHQSEINNNNQSDDVGGDQPIENDGSNKLRETLDQLKSRIETPRQESHISPSKQTSHHLPAISYFIKPAKAEIARIPSPPPYIKEHLDKFKQTRQTSKVNYTPRLMRITTVPVATRRPKASPFPNNVYYERPSKPHKRVTLEEAFTSRPPLQTDMDGPGPWSYSPRNKPLRETNSPMWSFGRKSFVEKEGGSRTSWLKTWFQNPHIWSQKTDFHNDRKWSSPNSYNIRSTCGVRQQTLLTFPAYTIGVRENISITKPGADTEPSPNEYKREKSDGVILRSSPAYSQRRRLGGTVLWQQPEETPGPGSYNTTYNANQRHQPAFTIRGIRRPNMHNLGPFASF